MDRISASFYVTDANGHRTFADENLAAGVNGTDVDAVWLAGVQESIIGVVEAVELAPTDADNTQLLQAINLLIHGYAQANLGFTPVQQGGGVGQLTNKVQLGWSTPGKLKATVDTTDLGNIAVETWAEGTFLALAGNQTVTGRITVTEDVYSTTLMQVSPSTSFINPAMSTQVGVTLNAGAVNGFQTSGNGWQIGSNNSNLLAFSYNSINIGSVTTNGTATAYNTTSDYRLKTNVQPLAGALDRVLSVTAKRFTFLSAPDAGPVDGFLAHEIAAAVPEAVTGTKDQVALHTNAVLSASGAIIREGVSQIDFAAEIEKKNSAYPPGATWASSVQRPVYQAMDASKLVPVLWAAVQELAARCTALEAKTATKPALAS